MDKHGALTKAHIIAEIKRTASANGGVPLGSRRFATQTGIRDSQWLGKFWARWGDGLQEAGFKPNQLQGAYEKTELLRLYAGLARDLGRLPTANDLRLQDARDPAFPNQKVFERLGSKSQLIALVRQHCLECGTYGDVVGYCESYSPRKAPAPLDVAAPIVGTVYLVKSGRFYKIGRSNSAGRREYEIALQMPERATAVHVIRTDDPVGIEAYWHNRFEAKRKNGEWFGLDSADVKAFKRRKFM